MNRNVGPDSPKHELEQEAQSLVEYVLKGVGNSYNFGNLTVQIYDTAWVSLLRKPDNREELMFSECHQYVMDHQMSDGGWDSYDSTTDGVINNLAGLLALVRNASATNSHLSPAEVSLRVRNASRCLQARLDEWDVSTCDYVGFEIIVPSMLTALEAEGVYFHFASKELLMRLNSQKLAKIHPAVWSGKVQTTVTHSLEAFLGRTDFTGLKNQLLHGSMGGSPASTAAYLMSLPSWNDEIAEYLRTVIDSKPLDDPHRGGVPNMYPSTGFEIFWIVATLIEGGFDLSAPQTAGAIMTITDEFYESLDGLASGFSKSGVVDADDTAKSIAIRNLLGTPTSASKLVETFEGKTHFLTYHMERHPSVTTNCNVLGALVLAPDRQEHITQIEKCAHFLCESWLRSDMTFKDKWNVSELYPIMLMSESLVRLLEAWDHGHLRGLSHTLLQGEIPLALIQMLLRTLQKQNADGSWGHKPSREMTAYGVIALSNLMSVPFTGPLHQQIAEAIINARRYIQDERDRLDIEYIWIGKASYSPINISRAYIATAQNIAYPKTYLSNKIAQLIGISEKSMQNYSTMFSCFEAIKPFPSWQIKASLVEASLFLKKLRQVKLDLFDETGMKKKDYIDFIAIVFCCTNNLKGFFFGADVLFEMMVLVLRVYQVDEFIEHIIGEKHVHLVAEIKEIVQDSLAIVDEAGATKFPVNNNSTSGKMTPPREDHVSLYAAQLVAFANSLQNHHSVQKASAYDRCILAHEVRRCLLAHLQQLEDSRRVRDQGDEEHFKTTEHGTYHNWIHSTGGAHICVSISLAFFRCLLASSDKARDMTESAEVNYLVQDFWMHLSAKGRMENDRASSVRDRKEGNLNSMDFQEFKIHSLPISSGSSGSLADSPNGIEIDTKRSKEQLTSMIEYEKSCCQLCIWLETVLGSERGSSGGNLASKSKSEDNILEPLKFYYFLSEIFDDVYTMRDISRER